MMAEISGSFTNSHDDADMMELTLNLDFACCCCGHSVGVTVQCMGKMSYAGPEAQIAVVQVPCPGCGQVNQLSFEPNGQIQAVRAMPVFRLVPEPSLN
jgi:hypothetical protein